MKDYNLIDLKKALSKNKLYSFNKMEGLQMKEYIGYFKKTNEINKITLYRVEDKKTNKTILSFDRTQKVTVDIHFNIKEGKRIFFDGNLLEKDNKNYFKTIFYPKIKINKYFCKVIDISEKELILTDIRPMFDKQIFEKTISIDLTKSDIDISNIEKNDFMVLKGNLNKKDGKYVLEDILQVKQLYNTDNSIRTYKAIIEDVNVKYNKIDLKHVSQYINNEVIFEKDRLTITYIKGYEEFIDKKVEFTADSKDMSKIIKIKILDKDYSDKEKRIKLKNILKEKGNKPGLYIVKYKEILDENRKNLFYKDKILLQNIRDLEGNVLTDHLFISVDEDIKLIDGNEYIIKAYINKYEGYRANKKTERYGLKKILDFVNYKGKIEVRNQTFKNISENIYGYMRIHLKYFMQTPTDYMFNNIEIYLDKKGIEVDKKIFQTTIFYLSKEYFNQPYFRNKQLEKEKYYRSSIYVEEELIEEEDKNIVEYKINIKNIDEIKYTKVKNFSKEGEGIGFSAFIRYNKKTDLPVLTIIKCIDLKELRNKSEKLTYVPNDIQYNKATSFIADIKDGEIINIRDIIQL